MRTTRCRRKIWLAAVPSLQPAAAIAAQVRSVLCQKCSETMAALAAELSCTHSDRSQRLFCHAVEYAYAGVRIAGEDAVSQDVSMAEQHALQRCGLHAQTIFCTSFAWLQQCMLQYYPLVQWNQTLVLNHGAGQTALGQNGKVLLARGYRYIQEQDQRMRQDVERNAAAALADAGTSAAVSEPRTYQQLLVGSVTHKVQASAACYIAVVAGRGCA